jgi:hypothetical protein
MWWTAARKGLLLPPLKQPRNLNLGLEFVKKRRGGNLALDVVLEKLLHLDLICWAMIQ